LSGSSPSPELHKLIDEIRALEFSLGCILQVIHVPGYIMIQQGTDGLSRGVWMTPLQALDDPDMLMRAVFEPVSFDPALVWQFLERLPWLGLRQPLQGWDYRDWAAPWSAASCFDTCTAWFPPPEVARQVITFALETWSERPLTTSFLFFVPRIVPAFWYGLSRHIHEIGVIYPHKTPLRYPGLLNIPVIVLYIAPHLRSLPTKDRLVQTPLPPMRTGTNDRRHRCVGCKQGLSNDPGVLCCYFSDHGFSLLDGTPMRPCRSAYHPTCIAMGAPFVSRRKHNAGLCFPDVKHWGAFVCEACTVRSVVGRELTDETDWQLLALERMWLIDMAHYWALKTHKTYQSKLGIIRSFESRYGVQVLKPTPLVRPPNGTDVSLMWCQESYGLRKSTAKRFLNF
jgi:hypothetical protein